MNYKLIFISIVICFFGLTLIGADQPGCGDDDDDDNDDDNDNNDDSSGEPFEADCDETVAKFIGNCPDYDGSDLYTQVCEMYQDAGCLYQCIDNHSGDCEAMINCYFENDCEYYETGGVCDSSWMNSCCATAEVDWVDCQVQCEQDISTDLKFCLAQKCDWYCYSRYYYDIAMCIQIAHCQQYTSGYSYTIESAACEGNCYQGFAGCYTCPDEGNHNVECQNTYAVDCRNDCPDV